MNLCLAERFVAAFERLVECACMPEFPTGFGGGMVSEYGADTANSLGATLVSHNDPNVKGPIVELTSSTAHDANWVAVQLRCNGAESGGGMAFLYDLLIGDDPEQVIIPDMGIFFRDFSQVATFLFPLFVPKGSRLAARMQHNAGLALSGEIQIQLIAGSLLSGSPACKVIGYGATANSLGTNIDPGGTANTKSAWVEITSATERDHHWLVIGHTGADTSTGNNHWLLDIGIGDATEQVLIPNIGLSNAGALDSPAVQATFYPIYVPKGSRLTARAQCSSTTDGDRDLYVRIYGS